MVDDLLPLSHCPQELRAYFGDRKLDISRRITACVACRKQKIKCYMPNAQAPCSRCRKRGLSCTTNRSLQMLLEDDAAWKQSVTRKLQTLEAFSNLVRDKLDLSNVDYGEREHDHEEPPTSEKSVPVTQNVSELSLPPIAAERKQWEVRMDVDDAATIPANCVGEVLDPARHPETPIFTSKNVISEGILGQKNLEALFQIYSGRLDHYLYHILEYQATLSTLQSRSPLLVAAICTVGSLHSTELSHVFDKCYDFFVQLASGVSMSNKANLDDVRGLLIGAFWLHDVSWNLISIAVRVATQNQLHLAFEKALSGDRLSYFQARLWYHLYICDHHTSIAYGRPPLVRDTEAILSASRFLQSRHAVEDDARLISQVEIWHHASCTLDEFGFNVNIPVPSTSVPRLRRCMIILDTWRADWSERFSPNSYVGEYPRKGVGLHFYFARLYLCSHAFRGLTTNGHTVTSSGTYAAERRPATTTEQANNGLRVLPPEMEEIATSAIHSAQSILKIIIGDLEIQRHLQGLSLYFDTMVAFAVVFLLKVATQYADIVPIDKVEIFALVDEMSSTLSSITSSMHQQHLLVSIARGVEKLAGRCRAGALDLQPLKAWADGREMMTLPTSINTGDQISWDTMLAYGNSWGFDTQNFDLLGSQSTFGNNDVWPTTRDFFVPSCWR